MADHGDNLPNDLSIDGDRLNQRYDVDWVESSVLETWDFDNPTLSRLRFLALIDSVPPGGPTALVYRSQVARTHSLQHEFDEANEVLDAAALRCDDLPAGCGRDHVRARLAIERGRTLNSAGSPDKAMPCFADAYELATAARATGLAIDALHMSAVAAASTAGPEASTAWNERAIAEAEASTDPAARRWLGSLLNNHGWDKHETGDHEAALEHFERALAAREADGKEPELTIARWTVARALRSLGRYDEALAIQDALAKTEHGVDDGFVHEERGECLLAVGRPDDARNAFARAYELLSAYEWMADSEPDRLARIARLSGRAPD